MNHRKPTSLKLEIKQLKKKINKILQRQARRSSRVVRLFNKLNHLLNLLSQYHKRVVPKAIGVGAFCMGIMGVSPTEAQQFADVVIDPFNLQFTDPGENPQFIDIDNDGDLDLLTYMNLLGHLYYENTGTAESPDFSTFPQANPFGLPPGRIGDLVDFDNDGDYDLFGYIGSYFSYDLPSFFYSENIGTPEAPEYSPIEEDSFGVEFDQPAGLSMTLVDLDDDGDFDIIGSSFENFDYFENIGDASQPQFGDRQIDPFNLQLVNSNYRNIEFADLDEDGDLDMLTYQFYGADSGFVAYHENIGSARNANFDTEVVAPFSFRSQTAGGFAMLDIASGDIDNDGDTDILFAENVVTAPSFFTYYENLESTTSVSDLPDDLDVAIFPTITTNNVNIRSNHSIKQVEIFDMLGRMIHRNNEHSDYIDVQTLAKGNYFVKLTLDNGSFTTKQIIKK